MGKRKPKFSKDFLAESQRMKAAVVKIHDRLQHDDVEGAREACSVALDGGVVAPFGKVQDFAYEFNSLAKRLGVNAAAVVAIPLHVERQVSLQFCGNAGLCGIIQKAIGMSASMPQTSDEVSADVTG